MSSDKMVGHLSDEQVHWDSGDSQNYGQYLGLAKILSVSNPSVF